MFDVVLIDNDLKTDHKRTDAGCLDDVLRELYVSLYFWGRSLKMDLSAFSVTIRDAGADRLVATLTRLATDPDRITVVRYDGRIEFHAYVGR